MKKSTLLFLSISLLNTLQVFSQANNFEWAKKMGGQFDDASNAVATDAGGNVYTTGNFQGTADFDPGSGTTNLTSNGLSDIFIQKLASNGTFVWAKQIGSTGFDNGSSIAIDGSGNVLVAGSFEGTVDFDPGAGTSNLTSFGNSDIFILKLDGSGNFIWAKQFGGIGKDVGNDVTSDAIGNIISTGSFEGTADFDPDITIANLGAVGVYDIFISKLDPNGNYLWAKSMGGVDFDFGNSVATDYADNIISTGFFQQSADFDPGTGVVTLTSSSSYDIYIQKLDAAGNFVWVKQMGGFGEDVGFSIITGNGGSIYSTGYFQNVVDFDPGPNSHPLTTNGGGYTDDIYVQKLDANGNFVWAVNMGGTSGDRGFSIGKDQIEDIVTTGFHSGTADFNPGSGVFNLNGNGTYIQKLDSNGNFIWAKEMLISQGNGIASDLLGNLFITGSFDHTVDFDPGAGQFNLQSNAGTLDAFVQKLAISSVGLYENYNVINASLYPNPSTGSITINLNKKYSDITLEITDVTGKLIYSENDFETEIIQINLNKMNRNGSALNRGSYVVSITADKNKFNSILVLQ